MQDMIKPRLAGFWARWGAELIDSSLLTVASTAIELMMLGAWYWVRRMIFGNHEAFFESFNALIFQVLNVVLYIALAIPYYVYSHYRFATTLGKRPLRIKVVNYGNFKPLTLKQAWLRCLGYSVSYLPLSTGFLMAAFHPEKRALHDLIAGTISIYEEKT